MMTTEETIHFIRIHYSLLYKQPTREYAYSHKQYICGLIAMASMSGIISMDVERELKEEIEAVYNEYKNV